MALLKDTWDSGEALFRLVQGENYPYSAIKNAYRQMSTKGNKSANINTDVTFNYKTLRYPGLYAFGRSLVITPEQFKTDTFDGLRLDVIETYSQVQALSFIPRLCPVMQTAKEAVEKIRDSQYYSCNYNVDIERVYGEYPGDSGYYPIVNIVSYRDIGDFIDSLSDGMLCVSTYKIYENNESEENSIISEWNASIGTPYDMYTPFKFQGPISNPGEFRTAFCGYLTGVLCPDLSRSPTGDLRWINYDLSLIGLKLAVFSNQKTGRYNPSSEQTIIYGDRKAWETFFNQSGFDWSFDENEVKNPNGDVHKPISPGQPENPVIDDPGDGDNISDPVEYPDLQYVPTSTVYDRYFITPNQIPDLKTFLFSETFVNNIKRLWTNPAEYVISLSCYPFDVRTSGLVTTNTDVTIGGVTSDIPALALTDIGAPYFYGGSVKIDNYYNSYLDYEPYTTIDIYLPYIGVRPLNVSQIVGHTLNVGYYIDFGTQQITALLGLDGDINSLGQVLGEYNGTIGIQTPLGGTSAQQLMQNIITQTTGFISGVGALAGGIATANPALIAGGISGMGSSVLGGGHTSPSYYGTLSPISALFSPQCAYLIINRPRQAIPAAYLSQQGFSSSFSGKVSEFSGYLECTSVNMSSGNIMTEQEQNEITRLLTGGIYI